jgi:hypothetical protein
VWILGFALATAACETADRTPSKASAPASAKADDGFRLYGEPLTPAPKVELSALLTGPEKFANQTVLVEGDVRRACTRKGCWLELAESFDPTARGCRVTFKDYGFFVPTNSSGSKARVRGLVTIETVSASHVQHLEEEGATFARKNPDGTAPELRLVATGVELKM